MASIISLFLIGGLLIASNVLTKSETVTANESLHEAEDTKSSSRLFETVINSTVECVRQKIKDGIPSLRIKSLDPLQIRIPIPLWFRNDVLRGHMILRKFRLEGLAGFDLTKGSVSISKTVTFGLNFDTIKLTSKYKAKLTLFGFMNIYGKGTLSIALKNLDINSSVKIKTLPRLRLVDLFLNITLPATDAIITGLLNDEYMSDLISKQLSDTLTTLAEEEHVRFNTILHAAANSLIDTKVNPALAELTIGELVDILKGLAGNCEKALANIVQSAATLIMDASGMIDSGLVDSDDYSQYEDDDL